MQTIHWRNREITAFDARTVTMIAFFIFCAGIPGTFFGIDIVES